MQASPLVAIQEYHIGQYSICLVAMVTKVATVNKFTINSS